MSRRWRLVTVIGDAGVGKSRLLFDFDAWLAERAESVWWFRGRASPYTQNSVNGLLRDVLTSRLGIQVDDTTDTVRRALAEGFTAAFGPESGPRSGALVGAWLGFDTDATAFELPSDPQALRDQGTELLGRYFHVLSEQVPVVILLEDLHWADEGTLRWLDAVSPELSDAAVLVVATTRPSLLETRPRWGEGLDHHVRLALQAAVAPGEPRADLAAAQSGTRASRRSGRPGDGRRRGQPVLHRGARHLAARRRGRRPRRTALVGGRRAGAARSRCRRRSRGCSSPGWTR